MLYQLQNSAHRVLIDRFPLAQIPSAFTTSAEIVPCLSPQRRPRRRRDGPRDSAPDRSRGSKQNGHFQPWSSNDAFVANTGYQPEYLLAPANRVLHAWHVGTTKPAWPTSQTSQSDWSNRPSSASSARALPGGAAHDRRAWRERIVCARELFWSGPMASRGSSRVPGRCALDLVIRRSPRRGLQNLDNVPTLTDEGRVKLA